CQQYSGLPPTF
nr:immunoglobulin light chain junction region [Macaca mulatta]MOW40938.1 immunoglobulin light chain junction region [Macaca mulatta]MOW42483.1 immunoglobulin light chain junction region [Macaca mulatta]MOW44145.1 immunoglobulin light chain junction region [Macaca mulatta]